MQVDARSELVDVGEDVAVAEDDALGIAGTAAGEQQDGFPATTVAGECRASGRAYRWTDRILLSTTQSMIFGFIGGSTSLSRICWLASGQAKLGSFSTKAVPVMKAVEVCLARCRIRRPPCRR